MLRLIKEAKVASADIFGDIIAEIKKDLKFADLRDTTINNCLTIFAKDTGIDKKAITAKDFIDWVNESGTFGQFIIDFADELSEFSIVDLGAKDEKFVDAVNKLARKLKIVDKDGKEITSLNGATGQVASFDKLCKWLFTDMNKVPVQSFDPAEDNEKSLNDLSDKTKFDSELFADMMKEFENVYKGIKEEVEETVVTPVPAEEEKPAEEVVAENPELATNAYVANVNQLITQAWDLISNINGLSATIDFDYKDDNKDAIKEILNSIVDDVVVDIGMLQKVLGMIDVEKPELLQAGEDKAEEVAENNVEESK